MSTAALSTRTPDALRPRAPGGMGRGVVLALLAHALLVLALAVALRWRSEPPPTYAAELWAVTPQVAAPRAQAGPPPKPAPTPAPAPPPPAPPPPAPAPEPARQPAPPPQPSAAEREAQIAIEQAKKKAAAEQAEAERAAREKAEQERAAKAAQEKAEQERLAQQKAQREKAEQEKAAQAERDRIQKEKAKEEAKQKELQALREKKAQEEQLAKLRADNLKRMMGQVGATGGPNASGTALHDAGPTASYAGKLIARVRPNILLTEKLDGNPKADVEVRAAPNGTILARRLVKSSGNKEWDEAVLRAIDRTGELPRDVDGRVPPVLVITFTP